MQPLEQNSLSAVSHQVFNTLPVRKSAAQKAAFRAAATTALQQAGWPVRTHTAGRLIKSHNLVAGNLRTAQVVFTAHYDTPARLPLPNFMAPLNLGLSLLYQLVLALLLCVPIFAAAFGVGWLTRMPLAASLSALAVCGAMLWLLMAGPANRHNANDNTSGVLALLELAQALPQELRDKAALVFFDNEELGLLGSAALRKQLGPMADVPFINFDCVGVGDTMLFCCGGAARKDTTLQNALHTAFAPPAGKQLLVDRSVTTLYPSDQMNFKKGVGVAALRKTKAGLIVSRIHTPRDTALQPENIRWLCAGAVRLVQGFYAAPSA